ncbi:hypothetical protein [Pantoea ananatis]|uniref:hypothetical protein n=1 Tax=Pantoea ananas TaxID=553 RepID=UPI001980BAD4|nr:hypothetical protein [Pantoea ananatis]MBN6033263.1 hypothetical protein [Pantoea ananatis]
MNKLAIALTLILISSYANAAYYFNLGDKGKLTVSKDLRTAVIVNGDKVIRTTLGKAYTEDIDNGGRPYNLSVFYDESCNSFRECNKPLLGIKNYNDKVKGYTVWMSEPVTKKILWQRDLSQSDLVSD